MQSPDYRSLIALFFLFVSSLCARELHFMADDLSYEDHIAHLKGHALLQLKDGSSLCCDTLSFNFSTFSGEMKNPSLISEKNASPFHISSYRALFFLTQDYHLKTIYAQDAVKVHYEDYDLSADEATHTILSTDGNDLFYTLDLSSKDFCHLTHAEGDMEAKTIHINTLVHRIWLNDVQGKFLTQNLQFKTDCLLWDRTGMELCFEGKTHVESTTWGTIISQEKLFIDYEERFGRAFKSIRTEGETIWKFSDQTFLSKGLSHLDKDCLMLFAENGIEFQNTAVKISANDAMLIYNTSLKPISVEFSGDVRIFPKNAHQLALADKAFYDIASDTLLLSAKGADPICFLDREKKIKIYAEALKFQKGSFEALGDMQLTYENPRDEKTL